MDERATGYARADEAAYRDCRDRYRALATSLAFEGQMQWTETIPCRELKALGPVNHSGQLSIEVYMCRY